MVLLDAVWCAIVLLSVVGQTEVQDILNNGPTVDSHGKLTTDEMHKQLGEWFNKCVQH